MASTTALTLRSVPSLQTPLLHKKPDVLKAPRCVSGSRTIFAWADKPQQQQQSQQKSQDEKQMVQHEAMPTETERSEKRDLTSRAVAPLGTLSVEKSLGPVLPGEQLADAAARLRGSHVRRRAPAAHAALPLALPRHLAAPRHARSVQGGGVGEAGEWRSADSRRAQGAGDRRGGGRGASGCARRQVLPDHSGRSGQRAGGARQGGDEQRRAHPHHCQGCSARACSRCCRRDPSCLKGGGVRL